MIVEKIKRVQARYVVAVLSLAVLGLVPSYLQTIDVLTVMGAMYFAIFAMSWDTVSGYTGQISFGHSAFFAAGGYTTALLNLNYGLDPWFSIPIGAFIAVVLGLCISVPTLRLRGPYLSLVTLIVPIIMLRLFIVFRNTFGGELGLSSPTTLLESSDFTRTIMTNYYITLALFVGIFVLLFVITRSDVGDIFTAIREDEDVVSASGINPVKFKIYAFVLSAGIGGLAGAFFVHSPVGNPQPSQLLALAINVEIIIATFIGGTGTIVGPAVGGLFFFILHDYLGKVDTVVPIWGISISSIDFLLVLIVTVFILFFMREGLVRWILEKVSTVATSLKQSINNVRQHLGKSGGAQ